MFHLLGVLDAFYQEMNVRFSIGFAESKVTEEKILKHLKISKHSLVHCLEGLKKDSTSWLAHAREMRNHTTHRTRLSRTFSASTIPTNPSQTIFTTPKNSARITRRSAVAVPNLALRDVKSY
jgi:hypothetical protein